MDDLIWGLRITVLGMGLVFGLLTLMWGLLALVQRLERPAAAPQPAPGDGAADTAVAAGGTAAPATVQGLDAELVAAITVATLRYRALRRREAAPEMRLHWPGSLLYASRWVGAGRSRQNHSWQRRGR